GGGPRRRRAGPHLVQSRHRRRRAGRGRADRRGPQGAAPPRRAPPGHLPVKIALLTYSTRPRGGVVHTLALAEALLDAGASVPVWTLGRGPDTAFFRAVDPRVEQVIVPMAERDGEELGARILRSIATLRDAFDQAFRIDGRGGYDIVHAQDCITANA